MKTQSKAILTGILSTILFFAMLFCIYFMGAKYYPDFAMSNYYSDTMERIDGLGKYIIELQDENISLKAELNQLKNRVIKPDTIHDTVFVPCDGGWHITTDDVRQSTFIMKGEYCHE